MKRSKEEQEKLDMLVEEFTEETIRDNPLWVKERKIDYLEDELYEIYEDIKKWIFIAETYEELWFREAILETCVDPKWTESRKVEMEIDIYDNPKSINYDEDITPSDIQAAKRYPIEDILGIEIKWTGDRGKVKCPLHKEKTASFVIYNNNTYYCFGCNEGGDSIDLFMKMYNRSFQEAVKELQNE